MSLYFVKLSPVLSNVQCNVYYYCEELRAFKDSLSLWVPSCSKKADFHGTPSLSSFCHSNTFRITHATPIRHITCPSPALLSSVY